MNKVKKVVVSLAIIAFWLGLWQALALVVGSEFLLPGIPSTLKALQAVLCESKFYISLLFTLLRVLGGFAISVLIGSLLAFLSYRYNLVYKFFSPLISVMKSTPVASFAILLWFALGGDAHTVVISFLMVMPIIFQNVYDGFKAINKELSEACDVFEFSFKKRMKLLVLPSVFAYFIPAVITGISFAWKAGIAAEIIGYTKNSIGELINDAKFTPPDTARIFALTLVIILLSVALEKLIKFLLTRLRERSIYI